MKKAIAVFGSNPLGPSRKVKAAIRKAVKDINIFSGDGLARLERLFLSKYGTDRESLLFANSIRELCFAICRSLRPKKVLIVGPAPGIYQEAALAAGAAVVLLSATEKNFFLPDMPDLVEKADHCDLVFIANPNRISGMVLSETVLKQLLAALSLKDSITVIDESLIEFVDDEGCIKRAANSSKLIVLRSTASYFGLPGLELAWVSAGPALIESLRRAVQSGPSVPAIAAARTALRDKTYRKATERFMKEEKSFLRKAIADMPGMIMYDSNTNLFLLDAGDRAAEIARRAAWAGPAVAQCSDIAGLGSQFLRVAVMKHDHNLKFIKMLKGIKAETKAL